MALRLRRGTDAERLLIIPESGELIYTTDTKSVWIGDGSTTGGNLVSTTSDGSIELATDETPQLGGDLDLDSNNITGTGNINITGDIDYTGTLTGPNVATNILLSSTNPNVALGSTLDLNGNNVVGVGNINIDGTITATGNINLGDGTEDNINFVGQINSNLIPDAADTYDIGSVTLPWRTSYIDNMVFIDLIDSNAKTIYATSTETLDVATVRTSTILSSNDSLVYDATADSLSATEITADTIYGGDSTPIYIGSTNTLLATTVQADTFDGDLTGSVFGDDSSPFFDAVSNSMTVQTGDINQLSVEAITGTASNKKLQVTSRELIVKGDNNAGSSAYVSVGLDAHNGDLTSPTTTAAGELLGQFVVRGYDGSSYKFAGSTAVYWSENATVTDPNPEAEMSFGLSTGSVIEPVATLFADHRFATNSFQTAPFADTASRDTSFPAPATGQLVFVSDNGNGQSEHQSYDGTRWVGLSDNLEIAAQGAAFTLALSDNYKYHRVTNASAVNVTVPPNSSVAFPIGSNLTIVQSGAGQISAVAGSGVTINSADSLLSTRVQYSAMTLTKVGTDEWDLIGDLA